MQTLPRWYIAGICCVLLLLPQRARSEELRPKHINDAAIRSVSKGLDYLARSQTPNGGWQSTRDGQVYPVTMTALAGMALLANGNTTSRGPYAESVEKATRFLINQQDDAGLIAGAEENGRSMYGHGFAMLFLSTVYGMETDPKARERIRAVVTNGIKLTARAQSPRGGWIYTPGGGGDEGSVTVTQMQALRAAHSAGFTVPKATIENAVRYLEICKTPEGGIRYSVDSGNDTRLPISAAAITCLYSAGEYESPLAKDCLKYVWKQFERQKPDFGSEWGHGFYLHMYASQSFYQAGDTYWNTYFPPVRDHLVKLQVADGHWDGNEIGPVYGTSIALIILQLPYKFLPIYQR